MKLEITNRKTFKRFLSQLRMRTMAEPIPKPTDVKPVEAKAPIVAAESKPVEQSTPKPPKLPKEEIKKEKPKQTENPTSFGNKDKESLPEGMIQSRDWLGLLGATIGFLATCVISAANLWAVMYGQSNPYLASLTVLVIPSFYWYIKTITGYDLNANAVKHEIEKTKLVKRYESQEQILKDSLTQKDSENWGLKMQLAVKDEKIKALEYQAKR